MIFCYSINHKTAPLHIREALTLSPEQQSAWYAQHPHTKAVILSTCNRLELSAVDTTPAEMDAYWAQLAAPIYTPYLQKLADAAAARHIYRVTCGLESMALGETQILGQVSRAYELALAHKNAGHGLSILFRGAIRTARHIHTQSNLGSGAASTSSLAIQLAGSVVGDLARREIVVIGAGDVAQVTVQTLMQRGITRIHILNRSYENAQKLANQWALNALPISEWEQVMRRADVVFAAAAGVVLTPEHLAARARPLAIFDLGVPRCVAAGVGDQPHVRLYDIDDLQRVVEQTLAERQAAIPQAEKMIEEALLRFWQDYENRALVPTIRKMREHAENIRQEELARLRRRLAAGNQDLDTLLEEFSHRLMNKMLHHPTHSLRQKESHSDTDLFVSVARDLFGLEPQ